MATDPFSDLAIHKARHWPTRSYASIAPRRGHGAIGFKFVHAPASWQYAQSHRTHAVLEGINSLAQTAKARACGYQNVHHFISVIYLLAAKLSLLHLT